MIIWERFEQASCVASRCQCEAPRDALIRQPASFWSSLAYLIAAFLLVRSVKNPRPEFKFWVLACVVLGGSSHLGHMSFTRLGLSFDFAAIILIFSFFALVNIMLLLRRSAVFIFFALALYYGLLVLGMYSIPDKWSRIGLCLFIFALSVGDVIREQGLAFLRAKYFRRSLFILLVSFSFFVLDEAHVACDPGSLFQFHALWHFGTAAALYYYGLWRFSDLKAESQSRIS